MSIKKRPVFPPHYFPYSAGQKRISMAMRGSRSAEAIFFISFGGPEKHEDIRPFLEIVTHGKRIPPERIDEVAHHYEAIGGFSPINPITRRQAEALQQLLNAERGARSAGVGSSFIKRKPSSASPVPNSELPFPVYVGHRNSHPFLDATHPKTP